MSIITPIRLQNRGFTELIMYKATPQADGDIAYFIYPPAGVTRWGVGTATVQINIGDADSITLAWGLFNIDDLTNYIADQAKDIPSGLNEPKFVDYNTAYTEDTIIQIAPPFSALRATFAGDAIGPDTWVTVGVS